MCGVYVGLGCGVWGGCVGVEVGEWLWGRVCMCPKGYISMGTHIRSILMSRFQLVGHFVHTDSVQNGLRFTQLHTVGNH